MKQEILVEISSPASVDIENENIDFKGPPGASAYQIALDNGFIGTEKEWLLSLKGPKGDIGPQGPIGATGKDGAIGPQGLKGDKGDKGDTGPKGENGKDGSIGPKGETGPQGTSGENGATFTPAVSLAGLLTWSNDKGLTNPVAVNIKGPKGDTGSQGPKGEQGLAGEDGLITSIDSSYLKVENGKLSLNYETLLSTLKNIFISQVNATTDSLWIGTQEEYDNIDTKNPQTTYIIKGNE